MTRLHDRLVDLADLGVPSPAAPPHEPATAWQRGASFRRRRRLGTAAIAVVSLVMLVGLGGSAFVRADSTIEPAGSQGPAGLPDRFYAPSPWLAGTAEEGPLGQVAVLMTADRGTWTGTEERVPIAISATTGEYRFLDLPDRAEGGELSPDGTRVAYWTTGPVTGTANTQSGQALVVDGLAVHDTVTGETTRAPIESEHGLSAGDLMWADAETLLVDYSRYTVGDEAADTPLGSGRGTIEPWTVWSVTDEGLVREEALADRDEVYAAADGRVLLDRHVLDLASGTRTRIDYDVPLLDVTAVDGSGTRIALPGTGGRNNRTPSRIQVTGVDGVTTVVPDSTRTYAVMGWADEQRVVVQTKPRSSGIEGLRLDLVDVRDGSRERLLTTYGVGSNTFDLATDLLASPTVEAVEPPSPLDPRLVTGGLVSIVLAAGVGLVVWRRRVRI